MADDPNPPASTDDPADPPADPPKDPALGDPGKKALDEERAARRDAERTAKAAEKARKELEERLAAIEAENATDQEKAIAAARKEGESEATARANTRIIRSEVKAAAATKLNDPNDAIAMLDLSQFEVDADGNVDEKAIASAIDELVTAKPYLAVGATPRTGNGDGGAHEDPGDLTLEQQIAEAEAKGDMRLSTSLKSQRLTQSLNL